MHGLLSLKGLNFDGIISHMVCGLAQSFMFSEEQKAIIIQGSNLSRYPS
jgi:hypothetical protein